MVPYGSLSDPLGDPNVLGSSPRVGPSFSSIDASARAGRSAGSTDHG
jgi:hypothetical protein